MREKIARAIHAAAYGSDIMWKESLPAADTVLDALMEPTRGMIEAGAAGSGEDSEATAEGAWEAMIQAAKEGK